MKNNICVWLCMYIFIQYIFSAYMKMQMLLAEINFPFAIFISLHTPLLKLLMPLKGLYVIFNKI